MAFSPDGTRIAAGSGDKAIRLWDTATGQPVGQPLRGHDAPVLSVAFSPDGTRIASASGDKTIRLWRRHRTTGRAAAERPRRRCVECGLQSRRASSGLRQ